MMGHSIVGRAYKYHPDRTTIFVVARTTDDAVFFECGHVVLKDDFINFYDIKERKFNYSIFSKSK